MFKMGLGGNEGKATQNYAHSASNCATVIILQSPICFHSFFIHFLSDGFAFSPDGFFVEFVGAENLS